ncbi:hypothetical protein OAW28_03055 [Alphaproteobacteria bacterium]|nr:hypothetical protein [Alphaproteobacteria bacterium]
MSEYRTGNWSWDISKIINAYAPEDSLQVTLTQSIEASFSDVFEEEHLRSFSRYFEVALFRDDDRVDYTMFYEVVIRVYKKHGSEQDNIEANLFWRHPYLRILPEPKMPN